MTSDVLANNRFRVIRPIGEGGMGVVYEAEDTERGQLVALKTLKHRDPDTLHRLKREFRALAHLSHPNLVDFYDMVVAGDTGFLTMELVEGSSIIRYCRPGDPGPVDTLSRADTFPSATSRLIRATPASASFDETRVRTVLPQLARALCSLHQAGMVHRDIKPPNVLVTHSARVVVLDFGLVADLGKSATDSLAGRIVGTVEYMAPEQVSDGRMSPAVDWYSFGCLLFEALTGRVPHFGPVMQVLIDKQSHPPPPPRALVQGIPPDLDALCVDLLAIDPARRPTGAEVLRRLGADDAEMRSLATVSSATSHGAFSGREAELAVLRNTARAMADGEARVVAVSGPSGIGKTELVKHFLESLARESDGDLVVLEGRCYERESVPYKAIDGVIDELTRYWSGLPAARAAELLPGNAPLLPRLFPQLGRVPAIASAPRGEPPSDPHELRQAAFSALRHLLARLAVQRELVVFLDDLQWGDLDSIRLIADLMRQPHPPSLLLVFCSRDESEPGSWDEVSVDAPIRHAAIDSLLSALSPRLTRIELGPLAAPDAVSLARHYLRGGQEKQAERVAEEAGGLPLFISELAIHMQTVAPGETRPISLDGLLTSRIGHLPDNARELLELVAVAGEPISQRVCASALSCSPEALGRAIRLLRTVHLVQAPGGRATDRIECYHSRIRGCVRDNLKAQRRRHYHRQLAVALEQWSEASTERLARHWQGAGESARAGECARDAADEAARKLDFNRAARLYRMALGGDITADSERYRLTRRLAESLANAGRPIEAASVYRDAAELADELESIELRHQSAAALVRGGYVGQGLSEIEAVLADIGAAKPVVRPRLPSFRRLRMLAAGARCASGERDLPGRVLTEMDVCGSMGVALSLLDTERGAAYQARYLELALRYGEPRRLAKALAVEAGYLAGWGHYRRAEKIAARAQTVVESGGGKDALPYLAWAQSAVAMYRDSDWRRALDKIRGGLSSWRQGQRSASWETATGEQYQFSCYWWLGELATLAQRVPGFIRAAEQRGDIYSSFAVRVGFASRLHLASDDPDSAEREIAAAFAEWDGTQTRRRARHTLLAPAHIDAALYRGRIEDELRTIASLVDSRIARYPHALAQLVEAMARAACCRARSATGKSRDSQLAEIRKAVRILSRSAPTWQALAVMLEANLARLDDRTGATVQLLERAIASLDALEMKAHAACARRALGCMIAGDEGSESVRQADGYLHRQGIAEPSRWMAVFAPAFTS